MENETKRRFTFETLLIIGVSFLGGLVVAGTIVWVLKDANALP